MTQSKKIADVAIWSHIPPPIGGMTVHIERLIPKLNEKGITYQMYSFNHHHSGNAEIYSVLDNSIKWVWKLFFGKSEKVHYVFTKRYWIRFIVAILCVLRKKKVIIRVGGQDLYKSVYCGSILEKYLVIYSIKKVNAVVGVNREICELALNLGVDPRKVHYIPGFIPPKNKDVQIPPKIIKFFSNKKFKLITNGHIYQFNESDTYGIWPLIDVMTRLVDKYPDVGLVIFIFESITQSYVAKNELEQQILERNLDKNVLIYQSKTEFWPSLSISDLFIRNTLKDGDSNSIREAISLEVPVIASDCVTRPESVKTYSTNNTDELFNAILDFIYNVDYYKERVKSSTVKDYSIKIINLIKTLLNEYN